MTLDQQPVDIAGTLSWLPKKGGISASVLFLIGDALLLGAAVAGFALYRRRRRNRPATNQQQRAPDPDGRLGAVDPLDSAELSMLATRRENADASNGNGRTPVRPSRPPRV
jgi:hypothetical protein